MPLNATRLGVGFNPLVSSRARACAFSTTDSVTTIERQAKALEALADGERVGPVKVAKRRVGQETLCGEKGIAPHQEVVQRLACHPYSRQHATLGAVFQGEPQRPGAQGDGVDGNPDLV